MPTITTKDGTEIFYKDWGSGQPIVFSHGWPLSADDWDTQLLFFLGHGYRVIAHDRRGHGRSTQTTPTVTTWTPMPPTLRRSPRALDLRNAIHIGHSTGGGEVARYVARADERRPRRQGRADRRRAAAQLVKTPANPLGLPRLGVRRPAGANSPPTAAQFYHRDEENLPAGPFYGFNRPGAKAVSEAVIHKGGGARA